MIRIISNIPLVLIFTITFCLPLETLAQDGSSVQSIIPGSDELLLQKLHPYSYTFELYFVAGDQKKRMGTLTEKVRILKKENIIERVQRLKRPNQPVHVDSVRAELDSMIPVSHYSVNKNRDISLNFNSSGVVGTFNPVDSTASKIRESFDHPYFDSNWVDLAMRLLPLQSGYRKTFLTHEVTPDGGSDFVPYHIEVLKQEEVDGEKTWVVSQTKQQSKTTFFVKENSLELIKMEIPISDGQKMVMRRIY